MRRLPWAVSSLALLPILLLGPQPAAANFGPPAGAGSSDGVQIQLIGDTLPVTDTVPAAADTVPPPPDADPPVEGADTIPEPEIEPGDSIIPRNLPLVPRPVPPGWNTGVWEWDREEIQATRAITLAELLEEVPGVQGIRGGDYGNPVTVMGQGLGPGRVRIFADGAELAPLDGGIVDLTRVGLVGLDRVRVERRPGELRIELLGMQMTDPRAYTLLEVGTGDIQTNLFRGTFAHPDALGGNVLLALDRVDTDGPFRQEPGAAYGVHLRHTLIRSDDGGLAWSVRRMTSRPTADFYSPDQVNRTDWNLRGRYRLWGDVVADGFYHHGSLAAGGDAVDVDTLITDEARTQVGLRLAVDRGAWWAEGEARRQGGEGWPGGIQGLQGGLSLSGVLGASAGVERQSWGEDSGVNVHGRLWSSPVLGVSLFLEGESGRKAVPGYVAPRVPVDEENGNGGVDENGENGEEPIESRVPPRFQALTGLRVGAEFRREEFFLGASILSVDPDSLHPTGLQFDRGGASVAGGQRQGLEVAGRIPLSPILEGLNLEWDGQLWEEAPEWRYDPNRSWDVGLRYHNVFFETRNLELWTDVGMRGRNRMTVPTPPDSPEGEGTVVQVPVNQSYYARVQVRIVSAKLFVHWDNFTFRDDNQDVLGRVLPPTRVLYGVRWTLWN